MSTFFDVVHQFVSCSIAERKQDMSYYPEQNDHDPIDYLIFCELSLQFKISLYYLYAEFPF